MKRITSLLAAAFAALFATSASAGLLLYDGFATETDSQNRRAYLSTSVTHKLQGDNAKGDAWTTGLSASYPWSESSGVVFTMKDNGLSLPSVFADGDGDQFTARGGCAGYLNNGTAGDIRCKNRKITSAMPTTGTLYYRCLMRLETSAYNAIKGTAWRYAGTGLSTIAPANSYDNQTALVNGGFRIGFNCPATTGSVNLGINLAGQYHTVLTGITAGTTHLCIVKIDYDTHKASVYATPIANYSKSFDWTLTDLDASGLTSAFQVMFLAGVYQTNGGRIQFDEIAVGTRLSDVAVSGSATAPLLADGALAHDAALGTYTASATLEQSAATVSYVLFDGATATTNGATTVAVDTTASLTFAAPTDNKTYTVLLVAENAGGETADISVGNLYGGALSLTKASDGSETGLTCATVTVSRASADPFPLTVNYAFSDGTGSAGVNYVDDAGSVTIAADAISATILVTPIFDFATQSDTTMTVSVAAGNYTAPAAGVSVTIANFSTPAGDNYWNGSTATDGKYLASNPDNWTQGHVPTATETVVVDGNFSNNRLTWDAAAPTAIGGWEQRANSSCTVEFQTTYSQGLAIAGDAELLAGTWTGSQNSDAETYRIALTIGGDLTIASNAQITATGKGYNSGHPTGVAAGTHGGSVAAWSQVYGDFRTPTNIGAGGGSAGFCGGGAVYLAVTGTATVDGSISAQPTASTTEGIRFGAGGSIYLSAASIEGSGTINASGRGSQTGGRSGGGGGRVALHVTGADSLALPRAKVTATGTVGAWNTSGGAGTVFVKTRNQTNGTLIVDDVTVTTTEYRQFMHTRHAATPISAGETWTLDELQFRNSGILVVPEGTTLNVPLAAISSTADRTAGILYEGGTIHFTDVAAGGPYAISNKWTFQASAPYTFDGDVTISGGAAIGGMRMSGTFSDFATCDVTVDGDLTVASDGWLFADNAGLACANVAGFKAGPPHHGGQMAGSAENICYDSVFHPYLPAVNSTPGHEKESHGGGVIKLVVNGALTLDGKAVARGPVLYKGAGSGGSINITAKALSGSGLISASGSTGSIRWDNAYHGAGGRVAIKVTEQDVGTAGVWANITCQGVSTNALGYILDRSQNTSAGTIYLEGQSDSAKGGTIYVKNNAQYNTSNVYTWLPAAGEGADSADDFRRAALVVADRANVKIDAAKLILRDISVEARSTIDLNGNTLQVEKATLNGTRLETGTYAAAQLQALGYTEITDSSNGATGILSVRGNATMVLLK